jgi:hypothetical protein
MLARNINLSYRPGMTPEEVLAVGAEKWAGISEASLDQHARAGDKVIFVANNKMVAAATIAGWTRDDEGYVDFDLEVDHQLSADVAGVPFPDPWRRGQGRSIRYVDPAAIEGAVAGGGPGESSPTTQEVALDGFRLSVDATGRATLVVPSGRDVTVSARRSR